MSIKTMINEMALPICRMVRTHFTRKIPRGIHGEPGDIDSQTWHLHK